VFWVNLKIALTWCRQHWRWLVLSIAFLIVYAMGKRGSKSLKMQAELARKQYNKEKEAIKKSHEEQIRLRDEAQKRYSEAVDRIEQRYENNKNIISHAKKEEVKKMIKKAKSNPDEIDEILEKELGVKKQ